MSKLRSAIAALALLACISGLLAAADDPPTREAVAKKAKASTVLVDAKPKYGSAFCVHASGLFVTSDHVVRQKGDALTLIVDAGQRSQKLLKAKVVRRDAAADLALLKVDGDETFEPLPLGSDAGLAELTEVIACGFPFGTALGRPGEYPAVSVNVGSVTSLRRDKAGDLNRIQLDAAVNPGNSGGPVLDRGGKVVGVVVSGIRGSGVNQAIPVSHVTRFLARPEVLLTLPTVKAANRHEEFEFTARTFPLLPTKDAPPTELELRLSDGPGRERRVPMRLADGVYRAKEVPFPARQGPPVCRVDVRYAEGAVIGYAEDKTVRVGETEVKLSQLRKWRAGPRPEAITADNKVLSGKLTGVEAVTVKVGGQPLRIDLSAAAEVTTDRPAEVTSLSCTVSARQSGKEVGSRTARLYIEGVSKPDPHGDADEDLRERLVNADGPIAGTLKGVDFKADSTRLSNGTFTIQSGRDQITIFLSVTPGKDVYEYRPVAPQAQSPRRPSVHVVVHSTTPPNIAVHQVDYAMRIEFGKEKDGKTPAKFYLSLSDDWNSCIFGTFTVTPE